MSSLDIRTLLVVATLPLAAVAQVVDGVDSLAELQAAYQAESQKINAKYDAQAMTAMGEYSESLTALEQAYAKKGNLEDVVAVRAEVARFEKQRTIPEDALVETPVELRKLQEKFRQQPAVLNAEKTKALAKATAAYVVRLEKLKKSLTQSMKVDDALAVKAEIEKVNKAVTLPSGKPSTPTRRRKPIPAGAARMASTIRPRNSEDIGTLPGEGCRGAGIIPVPVRNPTDTHRDRLGAGPQGRNGADCGPVCHGKRHRATVIGGPLRLWG